MQILLTGGSGLIGSALIKHLTNQHTIIVLTRNTIKAAQKLDNKVKLITQLSEVDFNHTDVVINLAGEPIADKRWSKHQKDIIEQSRWQITQQIVDKIKASETPPHTLISGSAIGYYGRQSNAPIDETFQDCFPEFTHSLCNKWEQIALEAESPYTRVCLVRTGIVLASRGGVLGKMLPAFKLGLGGPISTGEQVMSWVHIDDMVQLLLHILNTKQLSGAINATSPKPVSNAEFSKLLASTLKRPNAFRVPKFLLQQLLGEMSDLLLYGQNIIPQKLLDSGFVFQYPDIESAFSQLLKHQ